MTTNVFLIRNGETLWHQQNRILGRRDMGLNETGFLQAQQTYTFLKSIPISEILSSPLTRTVQTAEILAQSQHIAIGRDPRLIDLDAGPWEGISWKDAATQPEFQEFIFGEAEGIPQGEKFQNALKRGLASLEESISDNPQGSNIVIVTHAILIQLFLIHYLNLPVSAFRRFKIHNGAISVLRFNADLQQAEILGINLAIPCDTLLLKSDI